MIIHGKAYPRAGLIGNPSDGYFGKTISFAFGNFAAEVLLYETPELEILPNERDHSRFRSMSELARDVRLHGYYGGIRLLKAAVKRFHDYCGEKGILLDDRNFTLRYESSIPTQVGLAGSSAIITACFRALMAFHGVDIPRPVLANLILSVENAELRIPAGLQDRVSQVYQGLVYMDFNREVMSRQGYGHYEELDPSSLPPLYIAYRTDLAEGTEVFHNDIRSRWENREPDVVNAMHAWAGMSDQVRELLKGGRGREIGPFLNAGFDLRCKIFKISEGNLRMVAEARAAGASAQFSGSGGAIVGAYEDEAMYQRLTDRLSCLGCRVLKPQIMKSTAHEEVP